MKKTMHQNQFLARITSTQAVMAGALAIASLQIGCVPQDGKDNGGKGGDDVQSGSCYVDRFEQPKTNGVRSVDLLFVSDTSGSMDVKRGRVADGIGRFVAQLPKDVDYRISVMLAHGGRSSFSGSLYQNGSRGPVLDSMRMAMPNLQADLKYLMLNGKSDPEDAGEAGLLSFYRSLEHGKFESNRARGFYRDDAALVVIFVSDENDICADYPAGYQRVPDPENIEIPAKKRDCSGVNPASVLRRVKERHGDSPLLFGAIVHTNKNFRKAGTQEEYGWGYMDLVELSGGVSVEIGHDDYSEGLERIGRVTASKLDLQDHFQLSHQGVDPDSIEVTVDGKDVPFHYDPISNEVQVSDPGQLGSVVEVMSCMPSSKPSPTPSSSPTSEPSPSPTVTQTPSPSPTVTQTPSPSPTVTQTPSPRPTPTHTPCSSTLDYGCLPSTEPSPIVTVSPSPSPTVTQTPSPSPTVTSEPSPSPTVTSEPSPSPTVTSEPSPSPTCTGFGCGGGAVGN